MTFTPPINHISFTLKHIAGLRALIDAGLFEDLDEELVDAILEEAGKFAAGEIAPLNRIGDEQGARLQNGEVILPAGWKEAYQAWVEGGWGGLTGNKAYGGQGLPLMLAMACCELWNAASMAFGINPVLTQAAVHALDLYGSEQQKNQYLSKLISGEWTGTMLLTEPHAGSDLGQIKARAVQQDDGSYRLFGTKIFITYGEHSLTENIIHMVLARMPDAPEGTKGISLFLVPKFLLDENGEPDQRNDIICTKLEHKLGIHASPTCVMNLGDQGGAVGYLIGEKNKGLNAMFTMMNEARLAVGLQGVGIAERAYQQALSYAKDRKQGRVATTPAGEMCPIIEHPDIRRILLTMKAKTAAARAICYMTAYALDLSHKAPTEEERAKALAKASLLTPLAKSYSTDIGVEVASEGVQVHGGMGYIEETGAAQHYRDARIAPIYEGTNGIQALDLVSRKLTLDNGDAVRAHFTELNEILAQVKQTKEPSFTQMADQLEKGIHILQETTVWMQDQLQSNKDVALAAAVPFCRLFSLVTGAAFLAKGASVAEASEEMGLLARHFINTVMSEIYGLHISITSGADLIATSSSNDLS